jgi:hypothetical protein
VIETFHLTYTLGQHGWATASFGDGMREPVEVRVSYLGDALGEYARAVRGILRGLAETSFCFVEEPGSHVFVLRREDDVVRVDVYRSADTFGRGRDGHLLTVTCGLGELATTCINCLRRVLDEHGEAEYRRRWRGAEFPITEFQELLELRRGLSFRGSTSGGGGAA